MASRKTGGVVRGALLDPEVDAALLEFARRSRLSVSEALRQVVSAGLEALSGNPGLSGVELERREGYRAAKREAAQAMATAFNTLWGVGEADGDVTAHPARRARRPR